MTGITKGPPRHGSADGPIELSFPDGIDPSSNTTRQRPAQPNSRSPRHAQVQGRRMTRREIAAPKPLDQFHAVIRAAMDRILGPELGKMLPALYVANRRADGRNGPGTGRVQIMAVRRDCLTLSERESHIRRLRKTRKLSKQPMAFAEANSLEAETRDLIARGELMCATAGLIGEGAR